MSSADIAQQLVEIAQEPDFGLPAGCPVVPLGHQSGTYWFIDVAGQVRSKRQLREHDQIDLFVGETQWLIDHYPPRRGALWDATAAAAALVRACGGAGDFDGRAVRGPGIWWQGAIEWDGQGRPGPVVVHCGDVVIPVSWPNGGMVVGRRRPAGCRIDDFVYTRTAAEPRPGKTSATAAETRWLLRFLLTWALRDGWLDAEKILGLIGASFIPALLAHRPNGAFEGDTGCGKSSLFSIIQHMHGGAATRSENTTEAALRHALAKSTRAPLVILNEMEAVAGGGRTDGLVELLRHTYVRGEGGWSRAGADATEGRPPDVAWLVGAIDLPPAKEEDANRRVPIHMGKLADVKERTLIAYDRRAVRAIALGPRLRRRVLEHLPRYRMVYRAYQASMVQRELSPRTITTWCTVLALADILEHDPIPNSAADRAAILARATRWADRLACQQMSVAAPARAPQAVLDRILSYRIEEYRGSQKSTVIEYLLKAAEVRVPDAADIEPCKRIGITLTDINERVAGLSLPVRYVAFATSMSGIDDIFRATKFADGLWKKQLLKLDGARAPDNPVRFGVHADDGGRRREFRTRLAILVPLRTIGLVAVQRNGADPETEHVVTGEGDVFAESGDPFDMAEA